MTDKETGIIFDFPGTQDDLTEAQERFHNQLEQREKQNRLCNNNALRNIHKLLREKYGNHPVSVLTVLTIIRDNGFMSDSFLAETFQLTEKDVRRALEQGLIPQSVKFSLAQYFEIED